MNDEPAASPKKQVVTYIWYLEISVNGFSEAETRRVMAGSQRPQNTRHRVSKALGQKSRQTLVQQSPRPEERLANHKPECHKYKSEEKPFTKI